MSKSQVIVVSGVMGGGKTTLIQSIANYIPDSYIVSFDDYSIDALPSAPPLDLFLDDFKSAVNQYDISLLMSDFKKALNRYSFILIDFPFGYEHEDLKPYINKVIYLRTPLDICFARQIIRDYSNKQVADVIGWAQTYLEFARPIFLEHDKFISKTADYILDGSLSSKEQIQKLKELKVI